ATGLARLREVPTFFRTIDVKKPFNRLTKSLHAPEKDLDCNTDRVRARRASAHASGSPHAPRLSGDEPRICGNAASPTEYRRWHSQRGASLSINRCRQSQQAGLHRILPPR